MFVDYECAPSGLWEMTMRENYEFDPKKNTSGNRFDFDHNRDGIFICRQVFVYQYCFFHSIFYWSITLSDSNSAIKKCNNTHSDCLKCDIDGLCKKCRKVLIVATGQCAETCPLGYEYAWSTNEHQMGRVCSITGLFWLK